MYDVSVIIPTFSPGTYLYESLNLLLDQTLEKDLFEVLIILNGPKEPYFKEINAFIREKSTFNLNLVYIQERGVSWARNKGIEIAKGKYVAFIDDDDLISTNYLESLLKVSDPTCIAISNFRTFETSLLDTKEDYISKSFKRNNNKRQKGLFKLRGFMSSVCAKMIPRSVIENTRFNTNFKIGEDSIFMAEISHRIGHLRLTPEDTIYYRRIREGSATRGGVDLHREYSNTLKSLISYFKIYLKSPFKYNFLFFLSRGPALLKTFIKNFIDWFKQNA